MILFVDGKLVDMDVKLYDPFPEPKQEEKESQTDSPTKGLEKLEE